MKNSTKTKTAVAIENTRAVIGKIVGIALIVIGVLVFITAFMPDKNEAGEVTRTIDPAAIIVGILLAACGAFVTVKSSKIKQLVGNFKEYVRILGTDPENSLSTIARETNQPLAVVKENIRTMIKKKFFANAKLDEDSNRLILNVKNAYQILDDKDRASQEAANARPAEMVTVKCPGCGASNNIPRGKTTACEYCGTFLEG